MHDNYPTASQGFSINACSVGSTTLSAATPKPMGEIDRELGLQAELTDILVSELSTLAAVLEPVLMPAPEGKSGQPMNPSGTQVGGRIASHNGRIEYAISIVRNLRNGVAL